MVKALPLCYVGFLAATTGSGCAFAPPSGTPLLPAFGLGSSALAASTLTEKDELVLSVVLLARTLGPVGVYNSEEEQSKLKQLADQLADFSDPAPALKSLSGRHELVYSAAPGGSSGKLFGPIFGRVTQEFVDDLTFLNAVEIGPLKLSLRAERKVMDDRVIQVSFKESIVSVFGNELIRKEIGGGGTWKYIFAGVMTDPASGKRKLLRVMETPSLFVIEAPVEESSIL
ncbi:predicted protein [Phaeodactylum tricornutum CCAP 1055/1]|jgi:hypothetical protein|uniref:Plastid lipid-associated protein/fibrillin conserved domain-containing protein n=2 Tax=Phaeodactylum tricornutum TaxID=2850 RepID=B7GC24_PHATC|nr:predicted protein [Phaeodactylum tricornutum CCAP 1055/1]EEC43700.1 predicted protein [Phaeodactylum tricornutum CCAP 1055/1]|eukprot:XP_002184641.1 predicted protein [Phaeodactylum tricornutum CCAP 1055/1]